ADRNRSHWSTSKTPSYTKSVSWQHHPFGKVNGCKIRSLLVISYAPDFKILKAQNEVTESLMVLVF
ncbi:hypothetical protein, partial [Klebsiella pneumoniae]|uniref:hypothetical protein n=1 Tax=Klebsiella pneumoniae TaxID=573 RepID=UPI001BAD33F8